MQQQHIADIAELKAKVNEHEKKIEKQDIINEAVLKISFVLESLQKGEEKRDQLFLQVSENLNRISDKVDDIDKKVDDQITELGDEISELQNQLANSDDKNYIKIDVREEAKKSWWKKHSLPIGIGSTILGALSLIAGILKIFGII
jgi:dGTP triphosphohydrolase